MQRMSGRSPLPLVLPLLLLQRPNLCKIAAPSMTTTPAVVGVGVRDQERAWASVRSKARFPATPSTSSPTGMAIASTGAITAPPEAPIGERRTRGEDTELVAT